MSFEVYKVIHLVGIMMLFLSLGAFFFSSFNNIQMDKKQRKPWMIMHGVSLFIIILGGFGLLARLGVINGFPIWVWLKLIIWSYFGILIVAFIKRPKISKMALIFTLLVGLAAAYIANFKPFL